METGEPKKLLVGPPGRKQLTEFQSNCLTAKMSVKTDTVDTFLQVGTSLTFSS